MEVYGAIVFMCIVTTWAAPVQEDSKSESLKAKLKNSVPTVRDQEKQLEYLASLAGSRPNGVDFEKVQTFKLTDINGKEKGVKETKSKVNGELLSDIKEKFKQDIPSGKPAMIRTEIDLPKAGVHKVLKTDSDDVLNNIQLEDNTKQSMGANELDLSPDDIAAYLFQADEDEFGAFDKMLQGLVNSSIMTTAEATKYKDEVRQAFNRLVMEAAEAESEQIDESFPGNFENPLDQDVYDLLGYQDFQNPAAEQFSKTSIDTPFTEEETLTSLIKNAMDEWLTNAIVTGDQDAEALLTNILNEVSKDDNPDDLGQMREMLMDFFTNEVLNSMVPRDQIEDISSIENADSLPKDQISTVSKVPEKESETSDDSDSSKQEPLKKESIKSSKETDEIKPQKQPTQEEKDKLKM
ncbi:hypothetical protein KUTeg_010848 [Tegillarca granosa]|uniref:Uncharacterized protein n=1 Tax=Tegillarca granosa TaxID=220873 RepID=A0ABQ9F266_TEGGR|nr:hypothetical protein KUTeg_010848 [Tegillarca granosa]